MNAQLHSLMMRFSPRQFLYSVMFLMGLLVAAAPLRGQESRSPLPNPADLPAQTGLPDPLVMFDGRKVTSREMWIKERRPELIRLFQHYMIGQLPPRPGSMTADVIHSDILAFDGKATLREVRLSFSEPEVAPIYLLLVVPNERKSPAPVVLGINYYGNHTLVQDPKVRRHDLWVPAYGKGVVNNRVTEEMRGSWANIWNIKEVVARGYAVASFYNGDVDPDRPDERGLQRHFPTLDPADACGSIGAWAWGLMRAVDHLVTVPEVDAQRIIVTGHSRMGKAALFAAAFDERIALAIPHQAGTGGSAPSRTEFKPTVPLNTTTPKWPLKPNETITDLNEKFPHWFIARFKEFGSQPDRMPFDQHCLVALCAPRPVLFTNGRGDTWINPAGQFSVLEAAAPVYELLGAGGGFTIKPLPKDGELAVSGKLGFFLRDGYHSLQPNDWKAFLDFADQQFGPPEQKTAQVPLGPIIIDPEYPHSFRHQNGERFFPMGDTAYYLIAQPTNVIAHYINVRREHGFNFVRVMAMTEGFWPFGGTANAPDYTFINESVMQKWDWVFDYAAARGMSIELILWGYGTAGGEGLWASPTNQDFWIRTLVNRFKHRPNLLMWTIANEFERYPDGKYQYHPGDVEWAKDVAARIRELDAVHPIGCHPSVWITDQDAQGKGPRPSANYKGFTQRRPQVVWPLWEGSAVNLNVTQNNEGVQSRSWGNLPGGGRGLTYLPFRWHGVDYPVNWTETGWSFEAAGLEDCMAEDWSHGMPVMNTEFGYQFEPGYESEHGFTTRQVHQPATVRDKAWKITTAGGYFATGFSGTAVSRDFSMTDVDNFRPESLEVLCDFFVDKTEYWKLAPHLELVASHNVLLALPGREYVAYFPRGGPSAVTLVAGRYQFEWLDPESGQYFPQPDLAAIDGPREFSPPQRLGDTWVLHLRKRN